MMKYFIFCLALTMLTACDTANDVGKKAAETLNFPQPDLYLGGGIELQVSEDHIGTVFGYDECPQGDMPEWLFGPSVQNTNCTLLSGKEFVNVRLILSDGSVVKESWRVTEGVGPTGTGIQIERPDGWLLREPEA